MNFVYSEGYCSFGFRLLSRAEDRGAEVLHAKRPERLAVGDDVDRSLPVEAAETVEVGGRRRRVLRCGRVRGIWVNQESLSSEKTVTSEETGCPTKDIPRLGEEESIFSGI